MPYLILLCVCLINTLFCADDIKQADEEVAPTHITLPEIAIFQAQVLSTEVPQTQQHLELLITSLSQQLDWYKNHPQNTSELSRYLSLEKGLCVDLGFMEPELRTFCGIEDEVLTPQFITKEQAEKSMVVNQLLVLRQESIIGSLKTVKDQLQYLSSTKDTKQSDLEIINALLNKRALSNLFEAVSGCAGNIEQVKQSSKAKEPTQSEPMRSFNREQFKKIFSNVVQSLRDRFWFELNKTHVILTPGTSFQFHAGWTKYLADYLGEQKYKGFNQWDGTVTLPPVKEIWPDLYLEFSEPKPHPDSQLERLKEKRNTHRQKIQNKIDIIQAGIKAKQTTKAPPVEEELKEHENNDDVPPAPVNDENQLAREIKAYEKLREKILTELDTQEKEAKENASSEESAKEDEESEEEVLKKQDAKILAHLSKEQSKFDDDLKNHEEGEKAQKRYFKLLDDGLKKLNATFILPIQMLVEALRHAKNQANKP